MTVRVTTPKQGALEEQVWNALYKYLTAYTERKLRNIRCPDHHERPQVNVTGTLKKPAFKIEGCCQKLVSETAEALTSLPYKIQLPDSNCIDFGSG